MSWEAQQVSRAWQSQKCRGWVKKEQPSPSYLGTRWLSRPRAPCSSSGCCLASHSMASLAALMPLLGTILSWDQKPFPRLLPPTDISVALSLMWQGVCPCLGHFRPQQVPGRSMRSGPSSGIMNQAGLATHPSLGKCCLFSHTTPLVCVLNYASAEALPINDLPSVLMACLAESRF